MPKFCVTGPLGADCVDYGEVPGVDHLSALHRVHRDALGSHAARRKVDRLVFTNPADQVTCAGRWRVWQVETNAPHRVVEILIPDVDAAEVPRAA
jgi:hypothetical protein